MMPHQMTCGAPLMRNCLFKRSAICHREAPNVCWSFSPVGCQRSHGVLRCNAVGAVSCRAQNGIRSSTAVTASELDSDLPSGLASDKTATGSSPVLSSWTSFLSSLVRRILIPSIAILAVISLWPSVASAAASSSTATAVAAPQGNSMLSLLKSALSFILHLDVHLGSIIAKYGAATYAILFGIVFAETGLVVTPFLPGDSLLFATGALAALGKLDIAALMGVYIVAATVGDAVNYAVGNFLGTASLRSSLVKKEYIDRTEKFYAKYGGKTIILARFVPIVRTFAPFVAGVGKMAYKKFGLYNIAGAILWTVLCTGAGFVFGNVPAVHDNFSLVVLGIVAVSLLPIAFEIVAARHEAVEHTSSGYSGSVFPMEGVGKSLAVSFH